MSPLYERMFAFVKRTGKDIWKNDKIQAEKQTYIFLLG
jgi:hypothetical protein